MYGTHLEQERIVISDALDALQKSKERIRELTTRYEDGMNVLYDRQDECDGIMCPMCGYEVARNDDYNDMRPRHCPECGTKLLY